ncbi:N-acetylglucosaminyl transferase component-domain-containing protein [Blakeslea trispora]|nr:N-acetylglucosaminyl transferase component-domain-containing protein [Blakeslea trispora]
MPSQDVIKLFWPSHLCSPKTKEGFIIGWHNTNNKICVASVVSDIKLKELQDLLKEFCNSGEYVEYAHINKVCNIPPQILGVLYRNQPGPTPLHTEQAWLTVVLDHTYVPVMKENNQQTQFTYQVVFYEQPNPKKLQFLALDPLELDISSNKVPVSTLNKKQVEIQNHLAEIIDYSRKLNGQIRSDTDELGLVLVQINSSYFLEYGIQTLASKYRKKNNATLYSIANWIHSAIQRLIQIVITSPKGFIGFFVKKMFAYLFMCILFVALNLAEVTLYLLNVRFPKFILNGVALKDLSAAGQQIDLRLQQFFFWPKQYMMLRKHNWANTASARAHYISFYNSMWLVANDIIIGLAMGSFLMANNRIMAIKLHTLLHTYTVESLQSMMLWFLESPAGLKLNHELGSFLSELFLWLIRLWTLCTQTVEPYTPQIIHFVGLSGIFGITMITSLLSDFLAFMTLHIYCFYMVAARIFNWQLVILSSLFNLFRGKKKNMLRDRIDSCDYDLDQLLLGTSLFTLLTFLFPTVLIYYMTFAVGRVSVIFLQAVMETILAFFNHFPLFAIMLRLKDPHRLPGGLEFEIFKQDSFLLEHHGIFHRIQRMWHLFRKPAPHRTYTILRKSKKTNKKISYLTKTIIENQTNKGSYFWMRNMPIPLGAIFFQYMLLWKRLSAHYFSAYVFNCLLHGEPIKPIPKLQYPMLPEKRPSSSTIWKTFKATIEQSCSKS